MPVLDEPVPSNRWKVMVEENLGSGENKRWMVSRVDTAPDRETAREMARTLVLSHSPQHPFSQKERSVYAAPGDIWVVTIPGAMDTFHFRVTVVEWLGTWK
jgi:hypothetical protein